jgi:E-phenylitaconyl-CoA hydratase
MPGVLQLHLAGGAHRNALGRSTIERLEGLVAVPPVGTRAIVITADEPDFCAGYDLLEASRGDPASLIAAESNFAALRSAPVPVIAALHGNVIGGGLELALLADIRIASRDTKLRIPAGQLGVVYSEAGVRLLVSELGDSLARAMLLGGRALDADEALRMGLFTEIVPIEELEARAIEFGGQIAVESSLATAGNRRVLDIVTGRVAEDPGPLHLASFAEGGDLARAIERFRAGRAADLPTTPRQRIILRGATTSRLALRQADQLVASAKRGLSRLSVRRHRVA